MACNKAPDMQGYKGKLNMPSSHAGKKVGMTKATQGQEESMNSQERGSCKLATSGSERSLPFHLQLFTSVQSLGDREGTNALREDFGPDIIGYWIRK